MDAGQRDAIMCSQTLGKMMYASGYRPVEVFARTCLGLSSRVYFSLNSSHLLRQTTVGGGAYMVGPDGSGSWSEQEVDPDDSGFKLLRVMASNAMVHQLRKTIANV